MVDVAVGSSGKSSGEQKKRVFSDGTKISKYGKYKTWTYRRWAWEFLCRKREFIEACDRAANGTELEKSRVAKEFGLVKFKHYSDRWTRENIFPTFKASAIKCWPNLGVENIEKRICITPGQVIIRFKMKSDIDVFAAIKAQVQRAELRLLNLLKEFNKGGVMQSHIENYGKEYDKNLLITYLRILDMKASGISKAEKIAEYIYEVTPNSPQALNIDNLARGIRRKITEAQKYAKGLHLYLALKLGRPSQK